MGGASANIYIYVCVFACKVFVLLLSMYVCLLPERLMSLSSRAEEHLRFPELTKKITAPLLRRSILPAVCGDPVGLTGDLSPLSLSTPVSLSLL